MKLPIRVRLAAVFCASFLALTALLEFATYASVRLAIHSIADRELETRLSGLVDHVSRHLGRYTWRQMDGELNGRPTSSGLEDVYGLVCGSRDIMTEFFPRKDR